MSLTDFPAESIKNVASLKEAALITSCQTKARSIVRDELSDQILFSSASSLPPVVPDPQAVGRMLHWGFEIVG